MTITKNLTKVTNHIENTAKMHHRQPADIQLLAVSKTWSAQHLREVATAGQIAFGENYLQEALSKIAQLQDLNLIWHFIGPIQSNKTKDIAQNFDWVQSVDRPKIAHRLATQRPTHLPPLNICIQVNIDDESTKSGVNESDVWPLAEDISSLERLVLRGLMVIPTKTDDPEQQRQSFHRAHALYQRLADRYPSVDTLSMGMSGDMNTAISEGSTMVRIGSALFGQRTTPPSAGQVN